MCTPTSYGRLQVGLKEDKAEGSDSLTLILGSTVFAPWGISAQTLFLALLLQPLAGSPQGGTSLLGSTPNPTGPPGKWRQLLLQVHTSFPAWLCCKDAHFC